MTIAATQKCLSNIREDIEKILGPRGLELQSSSQDISLDPIICHFDDAPVPNPFSDQSQPVVITQLSTTKAAKLYNGCVLPALNSTQMSFFIDRQIQESLSPDLRPVNLGKVSVEIAHC